MNQLIVKYGLSERQDFVDTNIPGIRLFQYCNSTPRTPMVYEPGIVIICQGSKTGYLGDQVYRYDANHYLLLTVPMPFECETKASDKEPLQGLFIDIDLRKLHKLVHLMATHQAIPVNPSNRIPESVAAIAWDQGITDIIHKIVASLHSNLDAEVLGPGLVNEMLYYILRSNHGGALYALAQHEGSYARIAKVLAQVHQEYAKPYTVEELASLANMSVSTFHRGFKQITKQSPLQYLKKIKLFKAKGLILHEGLSVSSVSERVGYESASQFSREFKRLFGVTPSQSKDIGYAELK
jgi:AraC-like DNA-binding protein